MEFKLDLAEIQSVADEFAKQYAALLVLQGHSVHPDGLAASPAKVEFDGRYLTVYLDAPDYWEYVENGAPAHMPPVELILKWVLDKGVFPTENQLGIAWAISKNMAKVGMPSENGLHVEPDHPFEKTLKAFGAKKKIIDIINKQMVKHIRDEFNRNYTTK